MKEIYIYIYTLFFWGGGGHSNKVFFVHLYWGPPILGNYHFSLWCLGFLGILEASLIVS